MQIKKGTWRIAILLPELNIAIKLPRIYLRNAWKIIKKILTSKTWLRWQLFVNTVYSEISLKQWLFRGIVENWQEFCFYQKTRHLFCVPTYFSLFGLFNIQKLGTEPKINNRDLHYQFVILTSNKARGHHYDNNANFSYQNGKLQILDYGAPRVQKVVIEFGNLLEEKFDINAKCPHDGIISGK